MHLARTRRGRDLLPVHICQGEERVQLALRADRRGWLPLLGTSLDTWVQEVLAAVDSAAIMGQSVESMIPGRLGDSEILEALRPDLGVVPIKARV